MPFASGLGCHEHSVLMQPPLSMRSPFMSALRQPPWLIMMVPGSNAPGHLSLDVHFAMIVEHRNGLAVFNVELFGVHGVDPHFLRRCLLDNLDVAEAGVRARLVMETAQREGVLVGAVQVAVGAGHVRGHGRQHVALVVEFPRVNDLLQRFGVDLDFAGRCFQLVRLGGL